MNLTKSYTPEYVLRLQQMTTPCGCQSCQCQPALLTLSGQNQLRNSALLGCDRAAQEILCREDAFVLHVGASEATDQPDTRQQVTNQGAINLLISPGAEISVKLYTLGIFLSKASQLAEPQQIQAVEQELTGLLQQGVMHDAFTQLPPVNKYKLVALHTLSAYDLDAALEPLTGMMLVMKLNEIRVLTSGYLEQTLEELEQEPRLVALMQQRQSLWLNALLYECYHHHFPGEDDWMQSFNNLCHFYFSLKMLMAVFLQNQLELSDENLVVLFAAWKRVAVPIVASEEALLVGLSLLR